MASRREPPPHDHDAVRAFVQHYLETHRERLILLALPLIGSRDEAEDAVQEAALHVLRCGLEGGPIHSGTIPKAVLNAARDRWRRRGARRRAGARYERELTTRRSRAPDPVRRLRQRAAEKVVERALATLSEAEREAFVARYVDGLEYAEIAAALGKSAKALRQAAWRGRKRFDAYLRSQGLSSMDDVW